MRTMSHIKRLISLLVLPAFVQAQVVIKNTDSGETATKTWTVTDLNSTNITVSTGNAVATGAFTDAGSFGSTESFSIEASARYGWNTADAQTAV